MHMQWLQNSENFCGNHLIRIRTTQKYGVELIFVNGKILVRCAPGKCLGTWFNIKMLSYQSNTNYKDEMVERPSHLYNGNSYIGKMTSSYLISPQGLKGTLTFQVCPVDHIYRKSSSINCTKYQNLTVSCLVIQSSLPNSLKLYFKLRMKM